MIRQVIDALAKDNPDLKPHELAEMQRHLDDEVAKAPDPTIALIGLTGVGKTSTINALFNAGEEISHFRPCTQEARPIEGSVLEFSGAKGNIIVYDMPGLGDSIEADERHFRTYADVLPKVDIAVWIFDASARGMTLMQNALLRLQGELGSDIVEKMVFAINKMDLLHPGETAWNRPANLPHPKQEALLGKYVTYHTPVINQVAARWSGDIIGYSAVKRYNLEQLMEQMVNAASQRRGWILSQRAAVADFRELVDPKLLQYVEANKAAIKDKARRVK